MTRGGFEFEGKFESGREILWSIREFAKFLNAGHMKISNATLLSGKKMEWKALLPSELEVVESLSSFKIESIEKRSRRIQLFWCFFFSM